jgi:hypothetical protein
MIFNQLQNCIYLGICQHVASDAEIDLGAHRQRAEVESAIVIATP